MLTPDPVQVPVDVQNRLTEAKSIRVQWEAWVATVQNFYDGNHREWWTDKGELIRKPMMDGEVWRTINLFPGAEDNRQNRLTRNEPQWHVKQGYGVVASQEDLDVANAYLQTIYRTLNWKDDIKQIIAYGDKRGSCPTVIGWDSTTQTPTITYYDTWDFYPDPTSPNPEGWQWLICSVPKGLDEIRAREDFDADKRQNVQPDGRYAQSGLKDQLERQRNGGKTSMQQCLLLQYFVKTKEGIMQYYIVGKELMKKPELLPYKGFEDFIDIYKPRNTERFYERPPMSDWVDPQKSVNKTFSNIEWYIDIALQGRWRRSYKDIPPPVGGIQGQIWEAAIGDIEQFPMIPLPQTHFQHLEMALRQFENVSQVHSESYGRLSGSGDISGVGINSIQIADQQNSAMAVDRLKTFLSRIAVKVLAVAAKNLKITTPIVVEQSPGQTVRMDVLGEDARSLRDLPNDVLFVKPFDNIDVEIIVGSAYSDFQAQDTVLNFIKAGYEPGKNPITDRMVTTFWRVGNQREVTKMLEDFRDPDRMIAAGENFKMRNGDLITPNVADNHQVHIEIHQMEAKKLEALNDMRGVKNIQDHIETHRGIMDEKRSAIRREIAGPAPRLR